VADKQRGRGKPGMDHYDAMESGLLYEKLKKNDGEAWTYIYNKFYRACRWHEWRLSDEEVEDVAAEAVAALIKRVHREDIEEVREVRGYALWVLRNEITNHYRKSHPTVKIVSIEDQATIPDDRNVNDVLYMIDTAVRVRSVVDKLPGKCKDLIDAYLKYLDGIYKTYDDIARALKKNAKTVYGNIVTCLRKLATLDELRNLNESV
jgi:RNA polymerase sigma factor (sigma-70 family)